jgi:hypothetical protein
MWLLNDPPTSLIKQRHGFELTPEFLAHAQRAAVSVGASGAFVSGRGLVMTNHHVAVGALQDLSSPQRDLMKDGFLARSLSDELPIPGGRVSVLERIVDVTDRITKAQERVRQAEGSASVPPDPSAVQAALAGAVRAESSAVERELGAEGPGAAPPDTARRARVVTLFGGAAYHAYVFRDFSDVRLVFAPEKSVGFFGGDTDNFEFPRFCFDAAFYRVYSGGKPYVPTAFFPFSPSGVGEGELVMVFGHPGRTQRLLTAADVRFRRDVELPLSLSSLFRAEGWLRAFANRGAEQARVAQTDIFGVANSRKAQLGQLGGLLDPGTMALIEARDDQLQRAVLANPQWRAQWGDAWEQVASVTAQRATWHERWNLLRRGLRSDLAGFGQAMNRYAGQLALPEDRRYEEFRPASLLGWRRRVLADVPIDLAYERHLLESMLTELCERLGADDPLAKAALAGKSPRARAAEVIDGSTLGDPKARAALIDAGPDAINASDDPALVLARAIEPFYADLRRLQDEQVEPLERAAYAKIAAARFTQAAAPDGRAGTATIYPDATGTLRLSFGVVKGYTEPNAAPVAPFTTIGGTFERAQLMAGVPGFELPPSWLKAKDALDLTTPFNFVCDADIIGGNSGSPVVNTKGQVVGLIFDGNIHSLPGAFIHSGERNRAVSVDSRAIVELLRKVYGAGDLADELTGQ